MGLKCLSQFWLLTRKNFILLLRNKLWTVFELLVPLLICLPIVILISKTANVNVHDAHSYNVLDVSGNYSDLNRPVGFAPRIWQRFCGKSKLKIAYSMASDVPESTATSMMQSLSERYKNIEHSPFSLEPIKLDNTEEMEKVLRKDLRNVTKYGCIITNFVGGVVFEELNVANRVFRFRIRVPNDKQKKWHTQEIWPGGNPYAGSPNFNDMPSEPEYWASGFVTFQTAINEIFLKEIGADEVPALAVQRFPTPAYKTNSIQAFLKFLPFLWGIFILPTVIHAAREMAAEKESRIKYFMAVMGLTDVIFYLSHVFMAFLKALLVCLCCVIPLINNMQFLSSFLFIAVVVLYALGAVMFAALMASLFKTANSALKLTPILWAISCGLPAIYEFTTDQIIACILVSLNINHAFKFAITVMTDYMGRERNLTIFRLFEDSTISLSLGMVVVMMIVDIVWMGIATLVIDQFQENSDSLFEGMKFCFKKYISHVSVASQSNLKVLDGCDEVDMGLQSENPDIKIEKMTKIWGETGERAVDELNLDAYKGQVTVLLGHNGAGKSTTFSVLCGLTPPTSGRVYVNSTPVGLCPQENSLFEKLSVEEHLWFFHELKGAKTVYENQREETLYNLGLQEKKSELAMNLSGGQKRKLCVGLAVIGKSQVVLLDEPTAGMDPGARKDVEKMLENYKRDRTILLTTHYMDEAELLGDRVFIMAKGRKVASGTPEFLKKKFGTGYILTIVVEENIRDSKQKASELKEIAERYVNGVHVGTIHGKQIELILPKEEQINFPVFFKELEECQRELGVASFGLSLNTLEQVFLKVGEMADPDSVREGFDYIDSSTPEGHGGLETERKLEGFGLYLLQFFALIRKRFLYMRRNWPQLITQLAIPIGLLLLTAYLVNITRSNATNESRELSFSAMGPIRVPLQVIDDPERLADSIKTIVEEQSDWQLLSISESANLTRELISLPKELPALGIGAQFVSGRVHALFNGDAYHALVTTVNLIANARLRKGNKSGLIIPTLHLYEPLSEDGAEHRVVSDQFTDMILAPLLIIVFALLSSTFVMFLVEERVCRFAHQQHLTPLSTYLFWFSSFLYDTLIYIFACAIFLSIFSAFGWMKGLLGYVCLLWGLYLWSCGPFIYAVSFLFKSSSKANTMLVLWQIVASIAALLIILLVPALVPGVNVDILTTFLMFILPSYAMGSGLMTLGQHAILPLSENLRDWKALGRPITMMFVFGCMSIILFLMFQNKKVRKFMSEVWDKTISKPYVALNQNEEMNQLDGTDESLYNRESSSESKEYALEVTDLVKYYGNNRAVNNLTFGVQKGECFGLLGVNGAGKTSTFDILTGVNFATKGSAKIGGKDVSEKIPIGYCPQFDAMLLDLTGRETLEILCSLHGYVHPSRKAQMILIAIGMDKHADKLIKHYSGGQRRKISVGIALLAQTSIVILDEPTAGVDPKARRDVWTLLQHVRDSRDTALLLTSHSMDECEALCSRIGILNKGTLKAEGTSQYLKSKFDNKYLVTLVIDYEEKREEVLTAVATTFPGAKLRSEPGNKSLTIKWQIPRHTTDRWSSEWKKVSKLAEKFGCTDFCLTQSSLEDTFLRLSQQENESSSIV